MWNSREVGKWNESVGPGRKGIQFDALPGHLGTGSGTQPPADFTGERTRMLAPLGSHHATQGHFWMQGKVDVSWCRKPRGGTSGQLFTFTIFLCLENVPLTL